MKEYHYLYPKKARPNLYSALTVSIWGGRTYWTISKPEIVDVLKHVRKYVKKPKVIAIYRVDLPAIEIIGNHFTYYPDDKRWLDSRIRRMEEPLCLDL